VPIERTPLEADRPGLLAQAGLLATLGAFGSEWNAFLRPESRDVSRKYGNMVQ
jgi:hypothetical protein